MRFATKHLTEDVILTATGESASSDAISRAWPDGKTEEAFYGVKSSVLPKPSLLRSTPPATMTVPSGKVAVACWFRPVTSPVTELQADVTGSKISAEPST